jgi:hypothetical protein
VERTEKSTCGVSDVRTLEKARRVIFFARYEASQFGSPFIETEHLLLGLLREDKGLAARLKIEDPSKIWLEVTEKNSPPAEYSYINRLAT